LTPIPPAGSTPEPRSQRCIPKNAWCLDNPPRAIPGASASRELVKAARGLTASRSCLSSPLRQDGTASATNHHHRARTGAGARHTENRKASGAFRGRGGSGAARVIARRLRQPAWACEVLPNATQERDQGDSLNPLFKPAARIEAGALISPTQTPGGTLRPPGKLSLPLHTPFTSTGRRPLGSGNAGLVIARNG